MIVDYWIIHRCAVDLPAMYDPHGRYSYWKGINWRALVALLVSVPPTIPGLAAAINASITLGPVRHMFDIAWLYGVSASCFLRGRRLKTSVSRPAWIHAYDIPKY